MDPIRTREYIFVFNGRRIISSINQEQLSFLEEFFSTELPKSLVSESRLLESLGLTFLNCSVLEVREVQYLLKQVCTQTGMKIYT
jgi:hypothetical protein